MISTAASLPPARWQRATLYTAALAADTATHRPDRQRRCPTTEDATD